MTKEVILDTVAGGNTCYKIRTCIDRYTRVDTSFEWLRVDGNAVYLLDTFSLHARGHKVGQKNYNVGDTITDRYGPFTFPDIIMSFTGRVTVAERTFEKTWTGDYVMTGQYSGWSKTVFADSIGLIRYQMSVMGIGTSYELDSVYVMATSSSARMAFNRLTIYTSALPRSSETDYNLLGRRAAARTTAQAIHLFRIAGGCATYRKSCIELSRK